MIAQNSKFILTIVISVINEDEFINQTLQQIYLQDFPMDKLEIVIVAGGSTEYTKAAIESSGNQFGSLKILENPHKLPSTGKNIGIKNSSAPYVLFLEAHTYIPSKNFLKNIIDIFQNSGASCLCRPQGLQPPDINEFELSVAICRSSFLGHKPGSEIYSNLEGEVNPTLSGAMYARNVFDKIGFFDENFEAGDDIDFNYRIKLAGLKSFLSPKLKVFSYPNKSIQSLWLRMIRYASGRFKFAMKHKLYSSIHWLPVIAVTGFLFILLLSLVSHYFSNLFVTISGVYLLVILTTSFILAVNEKHLDCLLYGPLIFPVIHFGFGVGMLKSLIDFTMKKLKNK